MFRRRHASIEPCLPRSAKEPPSGPDWINEIKHDGFRILAWRPADRVRLLTRHGTDFTARFPKITAAVESLGVRSCVLDGEAIVIDEFGLPNFNALRYRLRDAAAVLCAFDLLELDGNDLRWRSIEQRKARLAKLLRAIPDGIAYNKKRRRRDHLQARVRGYRFEAARLALSLWPSRSLAQDQEPCGAGGKTRSRRGLGQEARRWT